MTLNERDRLQSEVNSLNVHIGELVSLCRDQARLCDIWDDKLEASEKRVKELEGLLRVIASGDDFIPQEELEEVLKGTR